MVTLKPAGHISKRFLINYAVDPAAVWLPEGFSPLLKEERAIVGICLIQLTSMRPHPQAPAVPGYTAWGAAHRIAAIDPAGEQVSYLYRRYTNSQIQHWLGGTLFPGIYDHARIETRERLGSFELDLLSPQDRISLAVTADEPEWKSRLFPTHKEASELFRTTLKGYSPDREGNPEPVIMRVDPWVTRPVKLGRIDSTFISTFPEGAAVYDHTLLLEDAEAVWEAPQYAQTVSEPHTAPPAPGTPPHVPNPATGAHSPAQPPHTPPVPHPVTGQHPGPVPQPSPIIV